MRKELSALAFASVPFLAGCVNYEKTWSLNYIGRPENSAFVYATYSQEERDGIVAVVALETPANSPKINRESVNNFFEQLAPLRNNPNYQLDLYVDPRTFRQPERITELEANLPRAIRGLPPQILGPVQTQQMRDGKRYTNPEALRNPEVGSRK